MMKKIERSTLACYFSLERSEKMNGIE